jgi:tRNA (cmo5U34)-methyltransferase
MPELGTFDLIVSALSIHHLASREKRRLIQRVFSMLKPGGSFVNADQVLGPTPAWEKFFKETWKKSIEASGLPPAYRKLACQRMRLDREDTLARHLDWMRQAGFTGVACVYQWFPFAVMAGKKPIRGAKRGTAA